MVDGVDRHSKTASSNLQIGNAGTVPWHDRCMMNERSVRVGSSVSIQVAPLPLPPFGGQIWWLD